jgi:hypothetical protein
MMQASGGDATSDLEDRNQPGRSRRGCFWRVCSAGSPAIGGTRIRCGLSALSLSGKLHDRDGRFCRSGHRDLRAAGTKGLRELNEESRRVANVRGVRSSRAGSLGLSPSQGSPRPIGSFGGRVAGHPDPARGNLRLEPAPAAR